MDRRHVWTDGLGSVTHCDDSCHVIHPSCWQARQGTWGTGISAIIVRERGATFVVAFTSCAAFGACHTAGGWVVLEVFIIFALVRLGGSLFYVEEAAGTF
jgi:hypothetical protein